MSHAAFAGAALGMLISSIESGFDPQTTILLFTLGTAIVLGPLSEKAKLSSEVTLGVLFSLFIALGFTFLALIPEEGAGTRNAMELFWGSIWGLNYWDFFWLLLVTGLLIGILVLFFKEFFAITFHEKVAIAAGVRVSFFKFFLLCVVAIVVSFSLKIVGALLVYAMLILPTSCVLQFVSDFRKLFYYSPLVRLISAGGGMLLTFTSDISLSQVL